MGEGRELEEWERGERGNEQKQETFSWNTRSPWCTKLT